MEPNAFQIYILNSLNFFFPAQHSISFFTSAWLYNHLDDTEELISSWLDELVNAQYITYHPPEFASIYFLKGTTTSVLISQEYKITQKGRALLSLDKARRKLELINSSRSLIEKIESDVSNGVSRYTKEITEHIFFLKGRWNGTLIMTEENYHRLIKYTCFLVENNALPSDIISIPPTCISDAFIKHTYYRLYKIYKNVARENWVNFLHAVFQQFTCPASTTSKKFSQYCDSSNYDNDKILIKM
jgi:hypothetical protein